MGQMATDKMTRAFAAARAPPPSLARWRRAPSRANAHDASRFRRVAAAAAVVVSSDPPPPTDPPSSSEPSGAHRDNDASRASRATAAPPPSPRRRIAPGGAKRGDNAQRDEWADAVVSSHSGGRVSKRAFEAHLGAVADLALSDVAVVLVGTKKVRCLLSSPHWSPRPRSRAERRFLRRYFARALRTSRFDTWQRYPPIAFTRD